MANDLVNTELQGDVAVVRFDDGKANAISLASLAALNGALDRVEKEAKSVVLVGRPGRFSGGFDLKVMGGSDPQAIRDTVKGGAELALRLYDFPLPVVIACSGHAIAMGAVLLLAADTRIGMSGEFKIGLNEVAIRLTLPMFATLLASDRLSRRHLQRATLLAELYDPAGALDAGFLDRVVAPESLVETAIAAANGYAPLDLQAHRGSKRNLRGPTTLRIRASIEAM